MRAELVSGVTFIAEFEAEVFVNSSIDGVVEIGLGRRERPGLGGGLLGSLIC